MFASRPQFARGCTRQPPFGCPCTSKQAGSCSMTASANSRMPQLINAQDLLRFPGEDAPGAGRRRIPRPSETPFRKKFQSAPLFPQLTTEECYRAFPIQVKSSCPIVPTEQSASGVELLTQDPSVWRRPPVAVPASTPPVQDHVEYNQRVVASRHGGYLSSSAAV